jgi:streptogrisin C
MKRINVAAAAVVVTVVCGSVFAPLASAHAPSTTITGPLPTSSFRISSTAAPASVSPLLALETAVLTRQGASPASARHAIEVQNAVAQAGLVQSLEARMARAFAGVWFGATSAQLHIGVTSTASAQKAAAVAARAGLTADVTETPVHSTWAQLEAAQGQWNRKLAKLFAHAEVETALIPQRNALSVKLSSLVPGRERVVLEREASAADVAVLVSVAPASRLSVAQQATTLCNPFIPKAANCDKPITAGVTIQDTKKLCTAGPLAIPAGPTKSATFLLTAGHCVTKIGEPWFALNRSKVESEIGRALMFSNGTKGDYGDILVSSASWTESKSKNPVFAVMAEWGTKEPLKSYPINGSQAPVMGARNCHEGQTTGESCGKIIAINVTVTFTGGPTVGGLVEDEGAKSEGGDSGGPWFSVNSKNELLIEGTHVGKVGEMKQVYEPIATTLSNLGLELLTVGNENRP